MANGYSSYGDWIFIVYVSLFIQYVTNLLLLCFSGIIIRLHSRSNGYVTLGSKSYNPTLIAMVQNTLTRNSTCIRPVVTIIFISRNLIVYRY